MVRFVSLALAAVVAACVPAGGPGPSRGSDAGLCVALFERYDFLDRTTSEIRRDRWSVPPELMWQAQLLRQNGCITMNDDLTLAEASGAAPATRGAAIQPVSIAVGTVTSDGDDATVRAFFEERGFRARSVGKAGLGRRIYLGPVGDAATLAAGIELARAAGFVAPYPVRFW